jgi:hypothetical protein
VDIQRIRIRLASPTIPDLFAKVVDALEAARAPCVTSPLEPDAGTRTAAGLETADKLALAYYAKVASSVGARIPD